MIMKLLMLASTSILTLCGKIFSLIISWTVVLILHMQIVSSCCRSKKGYAER